MKKRLRVRVVPLQLCLCVTNYEKSQNPRPGKISAEVKICACVAFGVRDTNKPDVRSLNPELVPVLVFAIDRHSKKMQHRRVFTFFSSILSAFLSFSFSICASFSLSSSHNNLLCKLQIFIIHRCLTRSMKQQR